MSDLVCELNEHPGLAFKLGLLPSKLISPVERFLSFLRDTPNRLLQSIREDMVLKLIILGEITGKFLSTDSCPVFAPVKENNIKTIVKDRFDKTKFPKADPDATLGIYITFPSKS